MRKFLILFVLFFSLVAISKVNAQAPCICNSPSTLETVNTTYSDGVNTCNITITYCNNKYKNATIGGIAIRALTICSVSFQAGCTLNIDLSSSVFWNDMMKLVIQDDATTLNPWEIPDCNDPESYFLNFYYEVTKASCWILENDPVQQMYVFTPCVGKTASCWKKFAVCYNENDELVIQEMQTNIVGTSNCYYEGGLILNPMTFPFDECFDTCN